MHFKRAIKKSNSKKNAETKQIIAHNKNQIKKIKIFSNASISALLLK